MPISKAVIIRTFSLTLLAALCAAGSSVPPAGAVSRETPVVIAARKAAPAVVNIGSRREVAVHPFGGFGMNPFFDSFFKDFLDPGRERRETYASLGSGVIIDGGEGLILTNAHVAAGAGQIIVTLKDEREFPARVAGMAPAYDLALLRIEAGNPLPAVEMGDSDDLMIGETVIAIGNPFGFSHTVTTGVVSAVNRSVRTEDRVYHNFIQTDASINPGNSGGPLLNINGELIGINTAIFAKAQGIGFAIPITQARRIIADLIEYGEVIPGWLGLLAQDLDARVARYMDLPRGIMGALIREVEPGSPAERAGVRAGDVLLSVKDRDLASADDYRMALRGIPAREKVTMRIWREGEKLSLTAVTEPFPEELAPELAFRLFGIRARDAGKSAPGVVITETRRGAFLDRIGVRPGDVVLQIDDAPVNSAAEFYRIAARYRNQSSAALLLRRGDRAYHITVSF